MPVSGAEELASSYSYELEAKLLKGGVIQYRGLYTGLRQGLLRGDARSLDESSHGVPDQACTVADM